MTVSELIEHLSRFHGHEPVIVHVERSDCTPMFAPEVEDERQDFVDATVSGVDVGNAKFLGTHAVLFLQ